VPIKAKRGTRIAMLAGGLVDLHRWCFVEALDRIRFQSEQSVRAPMAVLLGQCPLLAHLDLGTNWIRAEGARCWQQCKSSARCSPASTFATTGSEQRGRGFCGYRLRQAWSKSVWAHFVVRSEIMVVASTVFNFAKLRS
jgi:hypothetical protein